MVEEEQEKVNSKGILRQAVTEDRRMTRSNSKKGISFSESLYVASPGIDSTEEDDDLATRFKDGELSDEELELIELGDEESLEDIKAKLKPKKSTISADMLDTANTYDDKVALVRLLVAEDAGRVANVLKKMIRG